MLIKIGVTQLLIILFDTIFYRAYGYMPTYHPYDNDNDNILFIAYVETREITLRHLASGVLQVTSHLHYSSGIRTRQG